MNFIYKSREIKTHTVRVFLFSGAMNEKRGGSMLGAETNINEMARLNAREGTLTLSENDRTVWFGKLSRQLWLFLSHIPCVVVVNG